MTASASVLVPHAMTMARPGWTAVSQYKGDVLRLWVVVDVAGMFPDVLFLRA